MVFDSVSGGPSVDLVAGNLKKHIACLDKLKEKQCEGEASLQNALELTSQSLRSTSMFTHNLSAYILMTMSFLRSFCVLEYFSVILVLSAVFAVLHNVLHFLYFVLVAAVENGPQIQGDLDLCKYKHMTSSRPR